ncbi:MAG: beta-ketoacyl-[acyl-carrier-protein] synthase family protein [Marinilabiliales bacterium]|nr:MAG: beta-ketoacyl-[acyl-carrier-protein] synthase family protein [Marinilabiliales bacterium]
MTRVCVTGIGVISAIGNNVQENWASIKNSRTGIGKAEIVQTAYADQLPVGEIKLTNNQLAEALAIQQSQAYTRTALLGMHAAKQAIHDAFAADLPNNIALISATSVGGMDTSEEFYKVYRKDNAKGNVLRVATHDNADSTEKIADFLGIRGIVSTISTACSSSLNSIMYGARLIKNAYTDCVLVGGTDALTRFTINGFNSLMILDKEVCRPFDETRQGLNLGEGAGFLVLESEARAKAAGKKIYGEIAGYGNACDAHHQTATSPDGDGPYLAMKNALDTANLDISSIDFINAHGTGTGNNDLTEGTALKRLFGDHLPPFSSTKAYTGHTLGAAGSIETIFSLLAMSNNCMLPNLNFSSAISGLGLLPNTTLDELIINNLLTNSFGFGGNDSSLILSKYTV